MARRGCPRRPTAVLAAAAITSMILAACGTEAAVGAGGGDSLRNGGHARAVFLRQARAVTERWSRSILAREWRTGLVLTDGAALIQIPGNAGFDSQRQKDMFWSGHFRLAASLPSGSPTDVIRWASGAVLRLPVENAQAAFRVLATRTPCGGPYLCSQLGDLTVIGMQRAIVELPTSRGLAQIPAWRFRLAQLRWTFTQLAVTPHALVIQPGIGIDVGLIPELTGISVVGRTLTLSVPAGGCSGDPPPRLAAQIYETATTVVIGTVLAKQQQPSAGQLCAGVELLIKVEARLRRSLGTRVVLDVRSGQPLPNPAQNVS